MRFWAAALAGSLVLLAGFAIGEPQSGDVFDVLKVDLTVVPAATTAQKKALALASVIAGKPSKGLKVDIDKARKLAKALEKAYGPNVILDADLDAVLDELEHSVAAQKDALAKRTSNQPDGSAKTAAQARVDSANAKLQSLQSAASREEKANDLGAALQDVVKGERELRDDFYFYAVVNGEAVFADAMVDDSTGDKAYLEADGRGQFFVIQCVGEYDQVSGLHDVVSIAVTGIPRAHSYDLQDYMATRSLQNRQGAAPDGYREILVKGYDNFVKFLKVDRKRRIVSGIFQFTAHEDNDEKKVDRVRYGSFRARYL